MSVEFEPVRLGPRRRRVDPLAVGALLVAIGLVVVLLKPWDAGAVSETAGSAGTAAALVPTPAGFDSLSGPHATAGVALPWIATSVATLSPSWDEVRTAVRPHNAWGIRAIVAEPSADAAPSTNRRFAERWYPLPNEPTGSTDIATVDVDPNDRAVVALGITFPAAHAPLDTRIWLSRPNRLEWVDAQAMDPDPSGGAFLYEPGRSGLLALPWGAGTYRIDVLVDGQVRRFGVTIPNRFSIVPDAFDLPSAPGELIDPAGGALPDLPLGLFVTVDGASIPLPAQEGPALDEAGAWLNVDPGTGGAPRSFVPAVFLPETTGLGVMLPPGSVVQEAAVRRLAPLALTIEPERVVDPGAAAGTPTSNALFRVPGGGAWSPGVYQISVVWADKAGLHDRSWHVELRPGPVRELPRLLLAARGYARYAGAPGVVVGTAEPLEGGPRSVAIRLLRPRANGATGPPARDRVSCDGVRVDGLPVVFGIAHPVDGPPSKVTVRVIFGFARSEEQPILTAAGDVPGLTLIAPVGDDTKTTGATVCLSVAPGG